MSVDITTLKLLRHRENFFRLRHAVPLRALDKRTAVLLRDFGRYFKDFPDALAVESQPFNLYFHTLHPDLKEADAEVYAQLFSAVCDSPLDLDLEAGLLRRLAGVSAAYEISAIVEKFTAGEEIDLREAVGDVLRGYDEQTGQIIEDPQVRTPIEDLLAEESESGGLLWRLGCLNKHIRPLIPGDFVIVAARPDTGKTTFAASELTFMAAQLDRLFPGEDRSILWFNNEGPGGRVVRRCFQSALGCTVEEMAIKSAAGSLRQEYVRAIGGRGGALRVFDVHGFSSHEVEALMRRYKPAVCVMDMIDNITFSGKTAAAEGLRTDQMLESMYGWARIMGVKYNCAILAMSQVSGDGHGLQFPTLPMLKDSKTGKQGAADVIITIGKSVDPVLEHLRYIGCTKNKKVRMGAASSPMAQVRFAGSIGRYVDE